MRKTPRLHPLNVACMLEIIGIIFSPSLLAGSFTGRTALRLAAILLLLIIATVRQEKIFTAPAAPNSIAFHYP
jgi:hypothetical protein